MQALRQYQRECIDGILTAYRKGLRRVLVSLPTGTGKTVVFANFPRAFSMKKRLLILAHRDELLEQAVDKLRTAAPDVPVAVEQGARRAGSARVVVASVPTLGRAASARLAALDPDDFSLVVVDEAHHAVAPTYRRVFEHFGLFGDTQRMLVGFTATPRRGDGTPLGQVFQDIVYSRGIEEMIRQGWLCPIAGWRVNTGISLDRVAVRRGDFVEAQLASTVNVVERNATVVAAYRRFAAGRRAIVFCADVAHARAMAATFSQSGIRANAVWGAMNPEHRRTTLNEFRAGATDVLTNCNVLTEGFDEPRVDCVLMARPTKSRLLYAQMIGRGTRTHAEKDRLVVIDVVDNSREHSLAGIHGVFDLPEHLDLGGLNALKAADCIRGVAQRFPWIDIEQLRSAADLKLVARAAAMDDEAIRLVGERIHFFSFDPPAQIRELTELAWLSAPGGDFALSLLEGERLLVSKSLLGTWDVSLVGSGRKQQLAHRPTLDAAIAHADNWVSRNRQKAVKLLDLDARWRKRQPTDKQLGQIRRMHAPVPPTLTRGQASWVISHHGLGRPRGQGERV